MVNDYIELGKISGFFGVKGWVKVFSYTRPRSGITEYTKFYLGDSKEEIEFTEMKESGKHIVGLIDGINDRDETGDFLGQVLYVKREELPALNGEFYWHELVGLKVINQEGVCFGSVYQMMETGANDVMVIRNEDNEETLIPYVMSHFVLSVDIEAGEIQVDWEAE